MHHPKGSPRQQYRQHELDRVASSASLAESFQHLRSLTVELAHFRPERPRKDSQVRYSVNLEKAKSIFLFSCPNDQCVGGDFDLTIEVARAITTQAQSVDGELTCQGWRNAAMIDKVRCHNVLRDQFTVGYK